MMDIVFKSFQQFFLFSQAQLRDYITIRNIFLGPLKFLEIFISAGIVNELWNIQLSLIVF